MDIKLGKLLESKEIVLHILNLNAISTLSVEMQSRNTFENVVTMNNKNVVVYLVTDRTR